MSMNGFDKAEIVRGLASQLIVNQVDDSNAEQKINYE